MRILVTGLIATYPVGGVTWDYLQYVHGFTALGHDVTYLEDTGQWVYSPRLQTFTEDCAENLAYLAAALRLGRAPVAWAFRDPRGTVHGMDESALEARCREADVFLNVSGCCWLRDAYRQARRAAYVDTDPCYSQAKLAAADDGTADEHIRYSAAMIRRHDVFFSLAENIGHSDCTIPTAGLRWHPTRPPIVLEDWTVRPAPASGAFTTVMSWKIDVTPPRIGGRMYGAKNVEFAKVQALPAHVRMPLEIALAGPAPCDALRAAGWRIVDARTVSATPAAYQDYIAGSRGEFSVAKEAYVATRSGWFSTRSASYLAMGRPVVVQNTGLGGHYPLGEAILAFDDLAGAAAALAELDAEYPRRCQSAREVAASAFDARVVLARLLAHVGS